MWRSEKSKWEEANDLEQKKQMLTVKELAVYIFVSESTFIKMIRESRNPFTIILCKIFFNKIEIDNWLNDKQVKPYE